MRLMIAGVPGATIGGSNVYSDAIVTSTIDGERVQHNLTTGSILYIGNEETPMVAVFFEGKKSLKLESTTGDEKSWTISSSLCLCPALYSV